VAVLAKTMKQADAENMPACFDASNLANVPLCAGAALAQNPASGGASSQSSAPMRPIGNTDGVNHPTAIGSALPAPVDQPEQGASWPVPGTGTAAIGALPSGAASRCLGRYAVFVDAGYLYAASGDLKFAVSDRRALRVDAVGLIGQLLLRAQQLLGEQLLRVYWFDGARDRVPTVEQRQIARQPSVKVRLGNVNSFGQQKGVDALIRSDLQDLAENKAITDVILLAGDEDMVPAVEAAQAHGVRVHLWGVEPAFGRNQAARLQWEADTMANLGLDVVGQFVTKIVRTPVPVPASPVAAAPTPAQVAAAPAPQPPAAAASETEPLRRPSPLDLARTRAYRAVPTNPTSAPVYSTSSPGVAGSPAARGTERDWFMDVGELIANRWLIERGEDNLADLLPGPSLPAVIDQELLVAGESELGHSLRGYDDGRRALRDGFWSRLYREFGIDTN
jgi:uncharacterized LabA/DUF88 family protein